MARNGSSTPVYLVFDDASDKFSFEPQGAWSHEDPVAEQERYRGYGDGIRHTHPGLREANQSATVTLDSPQIAENRAIRLFGRVYGQTTNQNATQDLIIQYRLLDDEPATNQVTFSPNANISIDYGVAVADEKVNLEGSRIIVDDFDFDEIAFGPQSTRKPKRPLWRGWWKERKLWHGKGIASRSTTLHTFQQVWAVGSDSDSMDVPLISMVATSYGTPAAR
ncbi:hypothetical protein CC1G_15279 [Coprinopsis cinerea okayama7|uniref:Uncharacterized protein n=1 Tax=Coprinopsis cinerea (strain Okayama-7 / 130 / ATCC MYA-4618 / FGSC 9003) TaxID=240176 RepID=D6RQ56_COPC7|nr:hypothetical protein CC1G_15279 [Coprinopsis cinerea okayama7\|eukprot:XP_002910372.1 hypothetical protein CC1G_15279 [Coprinopsis cinerea okayama7\